MGRHRVGEDRRGEGIKKSGLQIKALSEIITNSAVGCLKSAILVIHNIS